MMYARAIFVLLFVSYAYFYQAGGWNQNSRFALVRAITSEHSVRIDPFQKATGDKAFFEGHYYSDKAPGLALTAVPIVAIARLFMALGGDDPESYGGIAFLSYLSTVLTVGLLTAAAGVSLFHVCTELGATRTAALFAALSFGLATPIWALATLFIGHALSAACLVFAFSAAVRIGRADESADSRLGAIVGLGAGWATVSEFPAAVPAALLAGLAVVHAWPLGRARAVRVLGALAGGALACVAVLMAFQYLCFGSPFHLAYSSEQGYESMRQGVFGIGVPRMMRLRQILFGQYRGLLPLAPELAVAPIGLAALLFKGDRHRRAALVAGVIGVYYVLLNAGYTYWEGGWSYGPRHLTPGIPFFCVGLAILWTQAPAIVRAALAALSVWGTALSLVAVATTATPPAEFAHPLRDLLLPAFRDGDLALTTQRFTDSGTNVGAWRHHIEPKAAFNLGMKIGLDGHASLIPLALVWLGCGAYFIAGGRAPYGSSRPQPAHDEPQPPPAPPGASSMPVIAEGRKYFLRRSRIGARIRVWVESAHPHGLRVGERPREGPSQIETPDALVDTDGPNAIVQVPELIVPAEKSWIWKQHRSARNARRARPFDELREQPECLA